MRKTKAYQQDLFLGGHEATYKSIENESKHTNKTRICPDCLTRAQGEGKSDHHDLVEALRSSTSTADSGLEPAAPTKEMALNFLGGQ